MASGSKLFLHDHPLSSYAQKIRIALREKGLLFTAETPKGLGSGNAIEGLDSINPRKEVPALIDGDFKMFDSSVILSYLEDKYPEKKLLPANPRERAEAKMIEEVCDTHYEAINWANGEIVWMGRAEGKLAETLHKQIVAQAGTIQDWLTERLGSKEYFNGSTFGYADVCVAPILNRAVENGYGPPDGSPLQKWHVRIKKRPAVAETFAEYEEVAKKMPGMKDAFQSGTFRREYRDHRLEFLIKYVPWLSPTDISLCLRLWL
jgi:glutathione S-transferase